MKPSQIEHSGLSDAPASLGEVRAHLRISAGEDEGDLYMMDVLDVAIEAVEGATGQLLRTARCDATWRPAPTGPTG